MAIRSLVFASALLWSMQGCMLPSLTIAMPALSASPNPSLDGAYRVSWAAIAGASSYRLHEDGELSYQGPNLFHAYANKPEGSYTYTLTYCVTALGIEACNIKPALNELVVKVRGADLDFDLMDKINNAESVANSS